MADENPQVHRYRLTSREDIGERHLLGFSADTTLRMVRTVWERVDTGERRTLELPTVQLDTLKPDRDGTLRIHESFFRADEIADEPMSDERLAEIREYIEGILRLHIAPADMREWQRGALVNQYLNHVPALLAEVERSRAKEATIHALVNNVISAIQDARNLARSQHWNQAVDDALIRAINEARYIQEDEPYVS